jgi:type IV secretion system protein VirB3
MAGLARDRLFVALTRPQMFAGVTYSLFVVTAELFLVFRSAWVLVPALVLHGIAVVLCLREPRALDLWLTHARLCGRVRNHAIWRCNSYRP